MLKLSNTKRDLRLSWLPEDIPDLHVGDHVNAHWEDMPDGTARLHLERINSGPTVIRTHRGSDELSVRWQLSRIDVPKFGQTPVQLAATGIIMVPRERNRYVPRMMQERTLVVSKSKVEPPVTVDGLRSSLRTAVDCINAAKKTLGDDLNLVVQPDGSLKIMLMMEI